MSQQKPNIVLVVMDTARAENLYCYGHDRETTPFLDELAEENVKYENAVSQENWTMPSHASMFSGQYASEHGISGSRSFADVDSFTDELSDRGYQTIGLTNVAFLSKEFDADELFDDFTYVQGESFFSGLSTEKGDFESREDFFKYVDLVSDIVKSGQAGKLLDGSRKFFGKRLFLEDSGASETNRLAKKKLSDQDKPFFLFLNYIEPHTPYLPPFPYSHKFLDGKLKWKDLQDRSARDMKHFMWDDEDPDPEQLDILESLYDGEINYLDSKLEELYEFITERYPDTVFIFTSDHGEYFYEHESLMAHGVGFYSQVNHVPLLEAFPEDVSKEVSKPVEIRSLKDHIIDISEGQTNPIKPGRFALSEDIRSEEEENEIKFSKKYGHYGVSVQDSDYKLAWYSSGKKELLKMPKEEVIEDEEKLKELSEVIEERIGNPEKNDYRKDSVDPKDDEIKDRLRELGYL